MDDIFQGTAIDVRGKMGENAPSLPWRVSSAPIGICCSRGESAFGPAGTGNDVEKGAANGESGVSLLTKLLDRLGWGTSNAPCEGVGKAGVNEKPLLEAELGLKGERGPHEEGEVKPEASREVWLKLGGGGFGLLR